jgi:hypothetical protein
MKTPSSDALAKPDASVMANGNPKSGEVTRSSLAPPHLDDSVASNVNVPAMPVPATLEINPPMPPPANGLTVQPVVMSNSAIKARPQNAQ